MFDISQSPFDHAFQPESYGLILANNVVHATPNLRSTLANLQPFLRPGGHLLLSEVCATAARAPSFVFGHFSGWWMGEADDRKWQPFVSVDRWDQELKAAGFTVVDTAVFDEDEPYQYCAANYHTQSPTQTTYELQRHSSRPLRSCVISRMKAQARN